MSGRFVTPEILDHLPSDDPSAIRSRRDLRLINFLMGNDRWILRALRRHPEAAARGLVEIGAGNGDLTARVARLFPEAPLTAMDLVGRPVHLDPRIGWRQGDLFKATPPPSGGILFANLFLHHFEGDALAEIGRLCENFGVLVFSEPLRAKLPHLQGKLLHPLVNHVTRHDMHVSIDAGFGPGELPELLGLSSKRWLIQEHSTWRGALRVVACRV